MRVGTSELVVIFVMALLVLGPEKVPMYAKKAGSFLSSIKVYADKLAEDINDSVIEPMEEVKNPLKDAVEPLANISEDINKPIADIKKSVNDIGKPKKKEPTPLISDEEKDILESTQESEETQELNEAEINQESTQIGG
jgi:sec-independent protein translocase protein TatB